MKLNKKLAIAALSVLTLIPMCDPASAAPKKPAAKKQVICTKDGNLFVRTGKCKKGEAKASLPTIVQQSVTTIPSVAGPQGPTGPKGDTGATGAQGVSSGFDTSSCYFLQTTSGGGANVPANSPNSRNLKCTDEQNDFLLSSSAIVAPVGSAGNKPFIQGKDFDLDTTGKYPIGVTYYFMQSVSGGSIYATFVEIVCCKK